MTSAELIQSILLLANHRVYIVAQGPCPLGGVLGTLPVRPVHGDHLGGGLLERRYGLVPGGQGIAACPGQSAVGECGLPGMRQRHQPDRTQAQFAALAVDEEPLDPLLVSGRLDAQNQSVLIAKDTRLLNGTDEGGGEFLAMWSHLVTLL